MRQIVNGKEMVLGTCYYPEHWPESLWRIWSGCWSAASR